MSSADSEFLKKLRMAFAMEAEEQLRTVSKSLLELEKNPTASQSAALVEVIFRQVHNLKGSAHAVNMTSIESLCQSLEGVFSALKKGQITVSLNQFDIMHNAVDLLTRILALDGKVTDDMQSEIALKKQKLTALLSAGSDSVQATQLSSNEEPEKELETTAGAPAGAPSGAAPDRAVTMDNIRLDGSKLDELLLHAEEMLSVKRASVQHAQDFAFMANEIEGWSKGWQRIDDNLRDLRYLIETQDTERPASQEDFVRAMKNIQKVVEFIESNGARTKAWIPKVKAQRRQIDRDMRMTSTIVDTFLDRTKKLLMMPCAVLVEMFPASVRATARQLGKDVDFKMTGTDIELDKRILTKLRDPLVHLIRNSIDHGVEEPALRVANGKPQRAQVTLAFKQSTVGIVEITVADDGRGVDFEQVKQAALKSGLIGSQEFETMTQNQTIDLIFQSALTTSPIITEISGHGLGLAIVKENIEALGGKLVVETEKGRGTSFRMLVPTTMATYMGILLRVHEHKVIVPTESVRRVVRVRPADVQSIDKSSLISLEGVMVPLVSLADLLEIPAIAKDFEDVPFFLIAVVSVGDQLLGLIVDAILDEQEVLVKSLGKPLTRVRNISGVTILRSGDPVPILNVSDLIKSARVSGASSRLVTDLPSRPAKRILVVDDTLTSRMLMKNIVESAGYESEVATDGLEALGILLEKPFDLVLLDVEMPRMTGLELTKKIRQNGKLADLPVILLTTLASKEDKERGVEAGANAYFVKSQFDQNSLLGTIKKLV